MTGTTPDDTEPSPEKIVANYVTDLLKNSIETVTEYRCVNHPQDVATSICEACGADICSSCGTIRNHKIVCPGCMGSLDKALGGAGTIPFFARLLTHPLFVAVALTLLLGYLLNRFGDVHRRGLLAKTPVTAVETEEQFRLKMLLFIRKADRIETHADMLREFGRHAEATQQFARAKAIYERLIPDTGGRWEKNVLSLAKGRILEKTGEQSSAEKLYETLASQPGPDKMYPVIAQFCLARLQEGTDREKALKTYKTFLRDINFVPDKLGRALDIMAHSDGTYNYESRIRHLTRTEVDFDEMKAEALLQMGRIFLALGRLDEAEYRLNLAVSEAYGTKLEKQVQQELKKLHALQRPERPRKEVKEKKERVVITHFD